MTGVLDIFNHSGCNVTSKPFDTFPTTDQKKEEKKKEKKLAYTIVDDKGRDIFYSNGHMHLLSDIIRYIILVENVVYGRPIHLFKGNICSL